MRRCTFDPSQRRLKCIIFFFSVLTSSPPPACKSQQIDCKSPVECREKSNTSMGYEVWRDRRCKQVDARLREAGAAGDRPVPSRLLDAVILGILWRSVSPSLIIPLAVELRLAESQIDVVVVVAEESAECSARFCRGWRLLHVRCEVLGAGRARIEACEVEQHAAHARLLSRSRHVGIVGAHRMQECPGGSTQRRTVSWTLKRSGSSGGGRSRGSSSSSGKSSGGRGS